MFLSVLGTAQRSLHGAAHEAHSSVHGGLAHRQDYVPSHTLTGQEAIWVCYVDAFGVPPHSAFIFRSLQNREAISQLYNSPQIFPKWAIVISNHQDRGLSNFIWRSCFWQEMRFFQARIGTLMTVCEDSVLVEVIIGGQFSNLYELNGPWSPKGIVWNGEGFIFQSKDQSLVNSYVLNFTQLKWKGSRYIVDIGPG